MARIGFVVLALLFANPSRLFCRDQPSIDARSRVGQLLSLFDEKASHILQDAAAAHSIESSKSIRSLQLEAMIMRQQFASRMDNTFNQLSVNEQSELVVAFSDLDKLNKNIGSGGKIGDAPTLDIGAILERFPALEHVPGIQKVDGSSQYFKPDGAYVIKLHGSIFEKEGDVPEILLAGNPLDAVLLQPPNGCILQIPASLLNASFADRNLSYVPIAIRRKVPDPDAWFAQMRGKYLTVETKFLLELLPKYPAEYRLTENDEENGVDRNRVEVQAGTPVLIPGCGESGCNTYFTVCTNVPPGAQPIRAVDFVDSFSGWGAFEASSMTGTGICAVYHQHSHNMSRNVRFNVEYHPVSLGIVAHNIVLTPTPSDRLTNNPTPEDLKDTEVAKFGTDTNADIKPGALKIDRDYEAHFSSNMKSFSLVVRFFTGEEILVNNTASTNQVQVATKDASQVAFKIKPVW